MTHDEPSTAKDLSTNLAITFNTYQQCLAKILENAGQDITKPDMDPLNISESLMQAAHHMASNPEQMIQKNLELAKNYIDLWSNVTKRFLGEDVEQLYSSKERDNRFKDDAWDNHPLFNFLKQSYYMNSGWLRNNLDHINGLNDKDKKKLEFYTKLLVDAMAPTNFFATNPEVIKETFNTNGENLVKGAENFYQDLAKSNGNFKISTTDFDAFKVGQNLAITPGKVVFKNDLVELIQYSPLTEKVFQTPLIIMPAWINKFYILDLQQKNSFVRWLVEQGYTVFMISWVNPDKKLSNKGFEDYMKEGPLSALKEVKKITGEKNAHFMGYCLGGTLLAATIAYLKAKGENPFPVKTTTFLTSLVDFAEAGDLSVFIDDKQISNLEQRMSEKGYLDGHEMAQTFSMIRANDMIWSFYVNNYLLGKDPFPFDILFWNSDSTRLPAKMHSFYLRKMYEENLLIKPGGISLLNTPIDLTKVDIPTYILSTIDDHITPWKSTYSGTQIYKGPVKFTLSGSGHVAGVVNPPSKNKYNFWTNDKLPKNPQEWLKSAKDNPGSWWIDWDKWASEQSGKKISARNIKDDRKKLENAPGKYVKKKL